MDKGDDEERALYMTPEQRQALMREASEALQKQWGDVRPDALQGLADELRTRMIEGGSLSANDIASAMDDLHNERSFFTSDAVRENAHSDAS